jgi:hypothetical protein
MRVRACLLLFLLPACVAPARSATDYENKAVDTAETALSSVQTGSLVVRLGPEQLFPPFISVSLSDAERAAASARATFLSIQPPDARSDEVRAQLSALLDRSEAALSSARIAARRQDFNALRRTGGELSAAADDLEGFIARYG